jgi:hypothetical protein
MKRILLAASHCLLLCGISLFFTTCKSNSDSSEILETTLVTPDPQAVHYIAKLDSNCGLCHGNSDSKMTFTALKQIASQTRSYHQCLEQTDCYGVLDKPKALACWNCITGAGGLRAQGGLYHTAIRSGIVNKIIVTAELDVSAASSGMLLMPVDVAPAPADDLAQNIDDFRIMAAWFTEEANSAFSKIKSVRPPLPNEGDGNNQQVSCDNFSPVAERQIIDDYSMEGVTMFGCGGTSWPEDPKTCLSDFENSNFADSSTPGMTVKILRRLEGRPSSAFWMRSSPDGRFSSIGNGYIEDVKTPDQKLKVLSSSIDPAFSPDNKFYVWPNMICPTAPLSDITLKKVGIDVAASGCVPENIGVYGSLGTDSNGDILLISGYTNNNFGGSGQRSDASNMPGQGGGFSIRRISNNRITEERNRFETPFETDYQISPTGKIVVGRLISAEHGQVFRVRTVRPDGITINPADNATTGIICMRGEKANISFDNRFVAFHHYADGADQDKGENDGTANIFIYDILKKRGIRVTNFQARTASAFFPHFRADGWLTFLIKSSDRVESIAISNAALILKDMP